MNLAEGLIEKTKRKITFDFFESFESMEKKKEEPGLDDSIIQGIVQGYIEQGKNLSELDLKVTDFFLKTITKSVSRIGPEFALDFFIDGINFNDSDRVECQKLACAAHLF